MRTNRFPGLLIWCFAAFVALAAADDSIPDAPGVTVRLSGSTILHRASVPYPKAARDQGIQGTVVVEATLDDRGNVIDARIPSGPDELRRSVLESVLLWHFAQDAANSVRSVQILFELPPPTRTPAPDFFPSLVVLQRSPAGPIDTPLRRVEILGLPQEIRDRLAARLPVQEGDVLTQDLAEATGCVVREFDEHLHLGFIKDPNGNTLLQIVAPGYKWPSPPPAVLRGAPVNGAVK
jgi:TonB family protein